MKTWTVDEMLAEHPCDRYNRERITELWAGKEALSLKEILFLNIPADDKLWVINRPSSLPWDICSRWMFMVVERAVRKHALHCGIPEVETWAERWLSGEDQSAEAARVARVAARVARVAAWAAWAAEAEAAAWAAEAAQAAWAAQVAERQLQIDDLVSLL
jgi:hypothetical protein